MNLQRSNFFRTNKQRPSWRKQRHLLPPMATIHQWYLMNTINIIPYHLSGLWISEKQQSISEKWRFWWSHGACEDPESSFFDPKRMRYWQYRNPIMLNDACTVCCCMVLANDSPQGPKTPPLCTSKNPPMHFHARIMTTNAHKAISLATIQPIMMQWACTNGWLVCQGCTVTKTGLGVTWKLKTRSFIFAMDRPAKKGDLRVCS